MNTIIRNVITFFIITISIAYSQIEKIDAFQAKEYLGKIKSVCGKVVSIRNDLEMLPSPIFLNLEKEYPDHIFTVFITSSTREKFDSNIDSIFLNKRICVMGLIKEYKGKPEIVVNNPKQITILP